MQNLLEWNDSYSVGVEVLDRQHRRLITLISQLEAENTGSDVVGVLFDELEDYVKEHFQTEEALLRDADYADFDAHRAQHQSFEKWMKGVRNTYDQGRTSPQMVTDAVSNYLRNWLVNHILSSDKAYRSALIHDED